MTRTRTDQGMVRRQLLHEPARQPQPVQVKPYPGRIHYGHLVRNVNGTNNLAVGEFGLVNEHSLPDPANAVLVPNATVGVNFEGVESVQGFTRNVSPWYQAAAISAGYLIQTAAINKLFEFRLTSIPSNAQTNNPVYSVILTILARRFSSLVPPEGALSIGSIQLFTTHPSVALTETVACPLGFDWTISMFRLNIIDEPTRGHWTDSRVRITTDANDGGEVQVAAIDVRLQYRDSFIANPPAIGRTNIYHAVYNRFQSVTGISNTARFCHYIECPWGYEMIRIPT